MRTIVAEDLWKLDGTPGSAEALSKRFDENLLKYQLKAQEEARKKGLSDHEIKNAPLPKNAVLRALNDTFFYQWWSAGVFKIVSDVSMSCAPFLSRRLIEFTAEREFQPIGKGVGYALGLVVLGFVGNIYLNMFFYRATLTGSQARAVLSSAIYRKLLRLSGKARIEFTNGKLTNLLSTDCHRIDFALQWFHFTWTFPDSITICLIVVLTNIGAPGLVGFGMLFCLFFLVAYNAKVIGRIRRKVNVITDKRVSVMREILQSMKIIKFYAWEEAYAKNIYDIRSVEMGKIKTMLVIRNFMNALFVSAPTLAGMVSFIVLEGTGGYLNPATVFSSLTSYNILRMPLMFLPLAMMTTLDAYFALKRIQDLLSASEDEDYLLFDSTQEAAIQIRDGEFIWEREDGDKPNDTETNVTPAGPSTGGSTADSESVDNKEEVKEYAASVRSVIAPLAEEAEAGSDEYENMAQVEGSITSKDITNTTDGPSGRFDGFSNLNLTIKSGEFVIITGSIGSGKSSLLSAMSGGMRRIGGSVTMNKDFVFCGQQWVQNATVEQNITFGKDFDKKWYDTVIEACSLTRDLEILPAGDQTEIGERGITISGGQKARINLARAVYWNLDIILLDDVLSAVDAHVGKYIMDNCICGLLKDKTRLLATHQLSMLPYADRVIFLDSSGHASIGTVDDLKESVPEFDRLLTFGNQGESSDASDEEEEEVESEELELAKIATQKEAIDKDAQKKAGALMREEDRAVDSVDPKVYLQFFKLGGGFLSYAIGPILLMLIIFSTFCQLFTNTWLSFWTGDKFPGRTEGFYIGIFVMFGVLSAVISFSFFFLLTHIVNRTSLKLHVMAVDRILHSPMVFFDTSPMGRILNRFTKDTDTIDNELSDQTRLFLVSTSNVVGVFILIIIFLPWFAFALVGLFFLFLGAAKFYRASAREIKRLDSLGRSILFSHFGETITGLSTIKAYRDQERFIKVNQRAIDNMNSAYYLTLANQRWLTLRLDVVAAGLTIVATMLCVTGQFKINPSSVGLVVSYLLMIVNSLSMIVRQMAIVENDMNASERVYHYAYNLESEAPFHIEGTKPRESWPERGALEFKDMTMSYQPQLPPVLKNINLSIAGGEKIGICGRTGAGKSSIMVALYRLCELTSGSIEIDGIDISILGLNELRTKLSIIPQDPVLFQGTIRSNIDPFGQCSDVELWDALRRSWLVEAPDLEKLKNGDIDSSQMKFHLDQKVDDDGTNFSLGERQLLALARALVRKSRILILDEATSSVDFETDHKVQTTIAKEFGHCTILCIAHRLNTILGYDKVLVLEHGEVAQFDDPAELIQQTDGIFYSMCEKSGITLEDVKEERANLR